MIRRITPTIAIAAVLLTACTDEGPTANSKDATEQVANPGGGWLRHASGRAFLSRARAFDLVPTPSGLQLLGAAANYGSVVDGNEFYVLGNAAPTNGAPMVVFVGAPDLSEVDSIFPGIAVKINPYILLGIEQDPDGIVADQPVIFDSYYWETFPLEVPSGYVTGTPTDISDNRPRPVLVGSLTDGSSVKHAVRWDWSTTTHQYVATLLPGGDPSEARAANTAAGVIVGSVNGHPALWHMFDNTVVIDAAHTGSYVDINRYGVLVGVSGSSGFQATATSYTAYDSFQPSSINDHGYVLGNSASGPELYFTADVHTPIPLSGGAQAIPQFLSNDGIIGGALLNSGAPAASPAVWGYNPFIDTDNDKIPDSLDNCPTLRNADQSDDNSDGIGNICQPGNLPVLTASATPLTVNEGAAVSFSASATDPLARRLFYAWDFGDAVINTALHPKHRYADEGTYNANIAVTNTIDTVTQSFVITVNNVAPAMVAVPDASTLTLGTAVNLYVSVTDAGVSDDASFTIDWGDGSASYQQDCGSNTCNTTQPHTYATKGRFRITITAQDQDGGVRTATRKVTVIE